MSDPHNEAAAAPHRHHALDYLEFPVADRAALAAAKGFLSAVFGWRYQDWGASYADTQDSGVPSGLAAPDDDDPNDAGTPSAPLAVVYSRDLEASLAAVAAAGGRVTRATFAFPGGRRFHFAVPGGPEMAVWSDR
jgi:predicted enzyme related to lactoylglutathione lyase